MKVQKKFINVIGKVCGTPTHSESKHNPPDEGVTDLIRRNSTDIMYSSQKEIDKKMNQFRTEYSNHLNQSYKFQSQRKRQAVNINQTDLSQLSTSIQAFLTLRKGNSLKGIQKQGQEHSKSKQSTFLEMAFQRNERKKLTTTAALASQNYSRDDSQSLWSSQSIADSQKGVLKREKTPNQQIQRTQLKSSTFKDSVQSFNQKSKGTLIVKDLKKPNKLIQESQQTKKEGGSTNQFKISNFKRDSVRENSKVVKSENKTPYLFSDYLLQKQKSNQTEFSKYQSPKNNLNSQRTIQFDQASSPLSRQIRSVSSQQQQEGEQNQQLYTLTQLFGQHLVSTLLQALVINQVNKIYGVKYNIDSGIPLSDQIIRMFDVDIKVLKSITKVQDRQNYLIKKMDDKIESLLEQQERKQFERQTAINESVKQTEKEQENNYRQSNDHFKWLDIKSKYDQFKRKLKIIMIQKLTLQIEKREQKLRKLQTLRLLEDPNDSSSKQSPLLNEDKIKEMKDVNVVDARSILFKLNPFQDLSYSNGDRSHKIKFFSNIKILADIQKDKILYLQTVQERKPLEDRVAESWDEQKEKEYQTFKKGTIQKYINSNFNTSRAIQLSFQPMIYHQQKQIPEQYNRGEILQKYENGIQLSNQEYEFIANTSSLLNKCIDKKFIQEGVNTLSENIIDYLERDLAEEIIMNHQLIFEKLKSKRNDYFKSKNEVLQQKFKLQRENQINEQNEKKKKVEAQKFQRIIKNRLNKLVDQNPIRQASYANVFIPYFVYKMKKRLEYSRAHQRVYATRFNPDALDQINKLKELELIKQKQRDFIQKISPSKDTLVKMQTMNTKRHGFHPPSVLSYIKPLDKSDFQIEVLQRIKDKKESQMQIKMQNYKLKLKDDKDQGNFQKFYSGGPLEEQPQIIDTIYSKIKESDIDKIIRIQRLVRRRRILSIIKKIKQQEFDKKMFICKRKLEHFLGKHTPFYQAMRINETIAKIKLLRQKKNDQYFEKDSFLKLDIQKSRSTSFNDSIQTPKSRFKSQASEEVEHQKRLSNTLSQQLHESGRLYEDDSILHLEQGDKEGQMSKKQAQKHKQFVPKPHPILIFSKSKQTKEKVQLNETQSTRRNTFHSKESIQTKSPLLTPRHHQQTKGANKSEFLLKQQKLLYSAKNDFFLAVKNAGFIFNPSDVMVRDSEGNSALYYAVFHKNEEFVNWLLSKGASPNQMCQLGNTPMHVAFQQQNEQSLLNWGGDINKVNIEGYTPLAYCPQSTLDKLNLGKCIIHSSKQKFEKHITNFDNSAYFFRSQESEYKQDKLELNNFYPLDLSENRTILLNTLTSE